MHVYRSVQHLHWGEGRFVNEGKMAMPSESTLNSFVEPNPIYSASLLLNVYAFHISGPQTVDRDPILGGL